MMLMQQESLGTDASSHAATPYTYRESDTLKLEGGYMIVYHEECHITMKAQLSEASKERGRAQMLSHREELQVQTSGIYIWYAEPDNSEK